MDTIEREGEGHTGLCGECKRKASCSSCFHREEVAMHVATVLFVDCMSVKDKKT